MAPINLNKDKQILSFNKTNRQRLIDEVDEFIAKQTAHLNNLSPELRKEKAKIKSAVQLRAELLVAKLQNNQKGIKANGRNLIQVSDKVY